MSEDEELLERLGAERCDFCHEVKKIIQWIMPHDVTVAALKLNGYLPIRKYQMMTICQECHDKRD